MSKFTKRIIAIISASILLVGVFCLGFFSNSIFIDKELREVYRFLEKYKQYYYFDDGDLIEEISNAVLDKYSKYYTKEEYELEKQKSHGNMSGVGLTMLANSLNIIKIAGNSPAYKAGVAPNGKITEINVGNGFIQLLDYKSFDELLSAHPTNKDFKLKIKYDDGVKEFTLQKQNYKASYVCYYDDSGKYSFTDKTGSMSLVKDGEEAFSFDNKTGYVILESFSGLDSGLNGSAGQMEEVLKRFKQNSKTKLILDLRGNGGGYLDILCKICKHLIDGDAKSENLVAYSLNKNDKREEYFADASVYSSYNFEKIILLADENTASASEALIGAMLDYDKKNIVSVLVSSSTLNGEKVYKSYGKGIMQSTYKNADGSAVKLTVAEIFWPISNTSIHNVGVIGKESGKILKVERENALDFAITLMG